VKRGNKKAKLVLQSTLRISTLYLVFFWMVELSLNERILHEYLSTQADVN